MSNGLTTRELYRAFIAIICVTVLGLISLHNGIDGDITKYAMIIIAVLGGGEIILEYWYRKKTPE